MGKDVSDLQGMTVYAWGARALPDGTPGTLENLAGFSSLYDAAFLPTGLDPGDKLPRRVYVKKEWVKSYSYLIEETI